jgi:nitroreductase
MALALPEDVKPELLVILGYPEKPVKAPVRRPLDEVLHWQKYRQEDEVHNG